MRRQFAVNVFGALAVAQALLPLLRRSLGRIVNVGSISGRAALPITGPYAASKAALDSFTQSLRLELAPFDVLVSYIEPGAHRTPIWDRSRRAAGVMRAALPPLALDRYGDQLAAMAALAGAAERHAGDPLHVARAIAHALQSPHPKARYTVGRDTRIRFVFGLLPAGRARDLDRAPARAVRPPVIVRLLPILGITFIDILGFSILIPLMPFYVQRFGASPFVIGVLFSTFALCQLIARTRLGQRERPHRPQGRADRVADRRDDRLDHARLRALTDRSCSRRASSKDSQAATSA